MYSMLAEAFVLQKEKTSIVLNLFFFLFFCVKVWFFFALLIILIFDFDFSFVSTKNKDLKKRRFLDFPYFKTILAKNIWVIYDRLRGTRNRL